MLFKTTVSKSKVICEGFSSQRAKAALKRVLANDEHSNEFWLAQSCAVVKWNFTLYDLLDDRHHRKRSVLSIKDKNEVADDIVFPINSKSVVSRLNVLF